ncbi:MAG: Rne/Rng family ribonuclease [Pseudomonadota bacterium]
MTKKMLIDAANEEEVRVCVLENGKVEDFDFESASKKPLRGNIYLARVTRVEPSLQAAFVEYGGNRHGFLAFNEIHPDYYQIPVSDREALQAAEAEEAELAAKLNLNQEDDDEPGDSAEFDDNGADTPAAVGEANDPEENDVEETEDAPGAPSGSLKAVAANASETDGSNDDTRSDALADGDAAGAETISEEIDSATTQPLAVDPAPRLESASVDEASAETAAEEDEDETSEDGLDQVDNIEEIDAVVAAEDLDADDADEDADDETRDDTAEAADAQASEEDDDDSDDGDSDSDDADDADDADDDEDDAIDGASRAQLVEQYREARRRRQKLLRNYKIQEVIKRRQILLIQVVKEERGNKGAALTTYLSLAGRYCVLMPNTARGGGISRKIPNASDRKRLRKVVGGLEVPAGMGLIIRTAGAKRTKAEIKRDYDYLSRLWENIRAMTLESIAPCLIYEEASLIKRAIRDLYDKDIDQVLVDGEAGYREAKDFMKMLMPSHAKNVQPYKDKVPLFLRHDVDGQLDAMYQPTVRLKSGGYLVINQTEALIAVDVNSGKATRERNIEQTALKTNIEAARELARQCRLRDLAGLIVVDFIDMEEHRNNRAVEKKFKDALKTDRARIQVGRISGFGLLEMSRQRRRSGIVDGTTTVCPTCAGAGVIRSDELAGLRILRAMEAEAINGRAAQLKVRASTHVVLYILNHKRDWLHRIEENYGVALELTVDSEKAGDQYEIERTGRRAAQAVAASANQAAVTPDLADAAPDDSEDDDAQIDPSNASDDSEDAAETSRRARRSRSDDADEDGGQKKRRRRRRRRRGGEDAEGNADGDAGAASSEETDADGHSEKSADAESEAHDGQDETGDDDGKPRKRRRRGRRGGRRNQRRDDETTGVQDASDGSAESDSGGDAAAPGASQDPADAPQPVIAMSTTLATPATPAESVLDTVLNRAPETAAGQSDTDSEPTATELTASPVKEAQEEEPAQNPFAAAQNPTPEPAPEPTLELEKKTTQERRSDPAAEAEKPAKPARKGWWQRALGG